MPKGGHNKLKPNAIQYIISLAQQGKTQKEIANETNHSVKTIRKYLKNANIKFKKGRPKKHDRKNIKKSNGEAAREENSDQPNDQSGQLEFEGGGNNEMKKKDESTGNNEAKKYQCAECGAMFDELTNKCPKCGVEFDL